jgi:hypothetical protein
LSQHGSSLFDIYSKKCSRLNLQSILNSPRVITISVGVYFYKYHTRYKNLKDLPYLFTKDIDNIISSNPKAFCIHNGYTSVIYLFSDCEAENYETVNEICIWLAKLQTNLKTIRFCTGLDRRDVSSTQDIILSELMAYFRMLKTIHNRVNKERVIMAKSISIISEIQKLLDNVIEYSDYDLYSKDVMEISKSLDTLINTYMYYMTDK